jgi:hypothetical protein
MLASERRTKFQRRLLDLSDKRFTLGDHLVEAAYGNSLEHLCSAAEDLITAHGPVEPIRLWTARHVGAKTLSGRDYPDDARR